MKLQEDLKMIFELENYLNLRSLITKTDPSMYTGA